MYSEATNRLQEEMMRAVNEIDKSYLRGIQASMHRCAALCCDDTNSSPESVQHCVERCAIELQAAQKIVKSEFDNFQDRLSRCHMACNDKIRDEMSGTKDTDIAKFRIELDKCADMCAQSHMKLVSQMLKRTKEALGRKDLAASTA